MNHWTTLGLDPCDDVAEIRRAYARRLKAIDVDSDPAGFVALREALNHALWDANEARYARENAQTDLVPPDLGPAMPEPDISQLPSADLIWQDTPEPDAATAPAEDRNARFVALDRLLFPAEGHPPPDPNALEDALRAILDHPEMENIDHSAQVEAWFTDELYHAGPNGDPILHLVIDHFGWATRTGNWDQPWMIDELIDRRDSLRLVERVSDPAHLLHGAWLDLTSDKERLGFKTMNQRTNVESLLIAIRQDARAAEAYLNPHRVALWEARTSAGVGRALTLMMFVFWGVFILFKIAVGVSQSTSTPTPLVVADKATVYSDPRLDLAPLIEEVSLGRVDLDMLEERNQPLYRRLMERWEQARDGRTMDYMLASDIRTLLNQAVRGGLRGGGYTVQSAYWRNYRDRIAWLRSTGVEDCDRRNPPPSARQPMPAELGERRREIMADALAAAPPDPPPPLSPDATFSYSIPGSVVDAVSRQTRLEGRALSNALLGQGSPAANCGASIALIDAALALPERQGARLLRDMSRGL